MAYSAVPTRSSADTNSSADINQLQDNIEATPATASDDYAIGDGTDTTKSITAQNADGNKPKLRYNHSTNQWEYSNDGTTFAAIGSGGGSTEADPYWAAGDFFYPISNPAALDTDTSGSESIKRHLFDDSTDQHIAQQFKIPSDIDTSGTVTFRMYGYASTAAADTVYFIIAQAAIAAGEPWDSAMVNVASPAKTCDSTQDEIDIFTWTQPVSVLAWAAGDFCKFRLYRNTSSGTLTGDYGVILFEISIPRT